MGAMRVPTVVILLQLTLLPGSAIALEPSMTSEDKAAIYQLKYRADIITRCRAGAEAFWQTLPPEQQAALHRFVQQHPEVTNRLPELNRLISAGEIADAITLAKDRYGADDLLAANLVTFVGFANEIPSACPELANPTPDTSAQSSQQAGSHAQDRLAEKPPSASPLTPELVNKRAPNAPGR
jgi:hypothetical protein